MQTVKKIPVLLLCSVLLFSACKRDLVDGEGVAFIENNFATATTKAKLENKPILLYIWWTECSVCAESKKKVFPDKELSTYLNEKFVNASQEYHASGAAEVLAKYPAPVTPYYFILKSDGTVVKSLRGWQSAKTLLKEVQAVGN